MAENQDNQLPPAILAELANQNPAPRTMCPHHGLPLWLQVQTFYNGVNPSTRQIIDAAAGGTINNKTPEEAYEFIEEMSLNNYQWQVMRTKPTKIAGVYNVESVTMQLNQVELLNKKIDGLIGSTQVHPVMQREASGGGSSNPEYQPYGHNMENEQLNYMGNQRPPPPSGFQQPPYQQEKKLNLEETLSKFITVLETRFQNIETVLRNQQASIQGLETQIGQLSKLISERRQGSLPSNTEPNPREQLNTINVQHKEGFVEPEPETRQETVVSKGKSEMPNVMKFLRELLANKRKLDEALHVELNAVCSAILQNKLPNKLKDLGSFTIPYLIGSLDVNNALVDLEASINVMPYKMFKQLGLGKPKQTRMSIQLADKTIRVSKGIIEDVLVKIDKFIFSVDFVVLDIEEDNNTPLILGRPFLATAKTIINVGTSELTLRVGDKTTTLQAHNSDNTSKTEGDYINHSNKTNNMVHSTLQEMSAKDVHEPCSSNNRGPIHEERRLQIKELDEWRTHKPRTRDKPKLRQNEFDTSLNQLKVRDKVLLDAADPHIVTANSNEEIPLTVLSIFPFGTVEVSHPKFGTFKVNNTRLKPYFNEIDSRNDEYELLKPP
ncbi:hypothetical protein CXB51_031902 [Gossypium anomalum]|uniref:Uncharacterized protein n=1 Tax=Gossypium anomalum TaxID=47600 RepID=A0A8J5Y7P6_9ROSI|nr:hypothetical protein CXB51_031902 [Gossypium anomalum]